MRAAGRRQRKFEKLVNAHIKFVILQMSLIKSRNWTQKEDQDLLAVLQELGNRQVEATWNQISELVKQRNPSSRKTGKQCRERWANQLDPKIKRNQNWTDEQNDLLFRLHSELGNKWSQICSHISGRTDNCVKNHFYSTMRRGMRKMNSYIENVKRKSALAKTFKSQILNKILAICQGKNDNKYQFNQTAKTLALSIKTGLIKLSLHIPDVDASDIQFKEVLFGEISQFSRNCRKRKIKKNSDLSSPSLSQEKQIEQYNASEQPNSSFQPGGKKQKKQANKSGTQLAHFGSHKQERVQNFQNHTKDPINKQISMKKINEIKIQQQKIRQKQVEGQKIKQSNPFAYIYLNFGDLASLFNLNRNNEEQQFQPSIFYNSNRQSEIDFQGSRTQAMKQAGSHKKNQSGVIIFSDIPSQINQQGAGQKQGVFSEIIKSQQIQPGFSFPFMSKQSNIFSMFSGKPKNADQNAGISFSPAFAPFSFCSASPGFNFINNAPAEQACFSQKFQSTMLGFSNSNVDKQSEGGVRKSSFKLLRKISIDEKQLQQKQQDEDPK